MGQLSVQRSTTKVRFAEDGDDTRPLRYYKDVANPSIISSGDELLHYHNCLSGDSLRRKGKMLNAIMGVIDTDDAENISPNMRLAKDLSFEKDAKPHTARSPIPELSLGKFQTAPWINFDKVEIGSSAVQSLLISNPTPQLARLTVVKVPTREGISIDATDIEVAAGASTTVPIRWTPSSDGCCKTSIQFRLNDKFRLSATVFGVAEQGPSGGLPKRRMILGGQDGRAVGDGDDDSPKFKAKKFDRRILERPVGIPALNRRALTNPEPFALGQVSKPNVPAHQQNRKPLNELNLNSASTKKKQISVPHKNRAKWGAKVLKLAATEMVKSVEPKPTRRSSSRPQTLYDERWIEKQEEGFATWVNCTVYPPEHEDAEESFSSSSEALKSANQQFLTLLKTRRDANTRRKAFEIFHSERAEHVRFSIEREVAVGRLAMRKDRDLHFDLGLRQGMVELLLNYNVQWLRLALEVVFGELLSMPPASPEHSVDVSRSGKPVDAVRVSKGNTSRKRWNKAQKALAHFIIARLINDPDAKAEYKQGIKTGFRESHEMKYKETLRQLTLKRFLLMVYFLDVAKRANVLERGPCLFIKESKLKSSKDILIAFCKDYLSGEGDFVRHLSLLGLELSYTQMPLDEFDFSISNIAVDLRDGVRLTKLVEILGGETPDLLAQRLRMPAVSRLQKIYNVDIALEYLRANHVALECPSGNISARDIVDGHRNKTLSILWQLLLHYRLRVLIVEDDLRREIKEVYDNLSSDKQEIFDNLERGSSSQSYALFDPSSYSELKLVLSWARAVCLSFGLKIFNFSRSFCDGKALCYMISYYHPELLDASEIQPTTVDLLGETPQGATSSSVQRSASKRSFEEALARERQNFELVYQRTQALGSVPLIMPILDSENPPEEKVTVTFTTYLCSRLLDSSKELRAAIRIQRGWRLCMEKLHLSRRIMAARVIQRWWYSSKWTRVMRRFVNKLHTSATTIQRVYKGKLVRNQLVQMKAATVKIQSYVRMKHSRERFVRMKAGASLMQKTVRVFLTYRRWQRLHLSLLVQRLARGFLVRVHMHKQAKAADRISSAWRGYHCRCAFVKQRQCAIMLQAGARMLRARRQYQRKRAACIKVQSYFKLVLCKKRYQRLRTSAVLVQSTFRAFQERQKYKCLKATLANVQRKWRSKRIRSHFLWVRKSVITVQALARGTQTRELLRKYARAATTIQSVYRMHRTGQAYTQLRSATVICQSLWRTRLCRANYMASQRKILLCQSLARGRQSRKMASERRQCIVTIQKSAKSLIYRVRYQKLRQAAILLQSIARRNACRAEFLHIKQAAIQIQSLYRTYRVKKMVANCQSMAVTIQAWFRGWKQRTVYQNILKHIALSQTICRMYLAKRMAQRRKRSVLLVQSVARRRLAVNAARERRQALVLLQTTVRGALQRRRYASDRQKIVKVQALLRARQRREAFCSLRRSAIVTQACWRRYVCQKRYSQARRGMVRLQSHCRGMLQRCEQARKRDAARRIQACVRRHLCQKQYQASLSKVVIAQTLVRGFLARKRLATATKACVTIQSHWRMHTSRRDYITLRCASICLESFARRKVCRSRFLKLKAASITFQKMWRGHRVRSSLAQMHESAMRIQNSFRMYRARKRYLEHLSSVVHVQAMARGMFQRQRLRKIHQAASRIQHSWKVYQQRQRAAELVRKVALIQATVRCFIQRRSFEVWKSKAILIQSLWRSAWQRKQYLILQCGATCLQALYRGTRARAALAQREAAATKIVAFYRMYKSWSLYSKTRKSLVTLQAHARRRLAQKRYQSLRAVALRMQMRFRNRKRKMLEAAIVIQTVVHGFLARVAYRRLREEERKKAELMQRKNEAATTIQRCYSHYLFRKDFSYRLLCLIKERISALVVIQRAVKMFLAYREAEARRRAVLQIQSFARGHLVRKSTKTDITDMRHRVYAANRNADESSRLCNRTTRALSELINGTRLTSILRACITLEVSTMYSRRCCERVAENAAIDILYAFIRSCNRSEPHVEVLRHALVILRNVASHKLLRPAVGEPPEAVETLVDLAQMFRDKEPILVQSVNLITIITNDQGAQRMVQEHPDMVDKLRSLSQLIGRKQKMQLRALTVKYGNRAHMTAAQRNKHSAVPLARPLFVLERLLKILESV